MSPQSKPKLAAEILLSLLSGCALIFSPWATAQPMLQQKSAAVSVVAEVEALPQSVRDAVLQAAANQTGHSLGQLVIAQASPRIWSDGCLGLGPSGQMCTAVLVRGWEVRVAYQHEEWVYRTNSSGDAIKLDPALARLGQMVAPPAEQILADQRPPRLDHKAVFRAIKTGGFAGINQETTLFKDGRLVQKDNRTGTVRVLRTVSKAELKAFTKQLERLHFGQFDGLRYGAPKGAADYFAITFSDKRTTVEYADINLESNPRDLQSVAKAWQSLQKDPKDP